MQTKGTYLLFISNTQSEKVKVGSLGTLFFPEGRYLYVGSALGPGGLEQRILRHIKREKKVFWHIDYLLTLESFEVKAVYVVESEEHLECSFSQFLTRVFSSQGLVVFPRFGSSDCHCQGHFFFLNDLPTITIIVALDEFSNGFQTHFLQGNEINY